METDVLMVAEPGAEAAHWQRRWADRFSNAMWIGPGNWRRPSLRSWAGNIERAVMMATRPVVLVAHSLGVSVTVHAAAHFKDTKVRAAFLVSPLDHESETAPVEAAPFGQEPRDPLPFPSMLVVSSNDPLCSIERAVDLATCWGSDFHIARNAGHIDAGSGHGPWPEGLMMFTRLMQRVK